MNVPEGSPSMKTPARRPYRLVDGMVFVAATAVAFAIFRGALAPGVQFVTFGGTFEQSVFFWMHYLVPFPAMWSLALLAIAVFDRRTPYRRKFRHANGAALRSNCSLMLV